MKLNIKIYEDINSIDVIWEKIIQKNKNNINLNSNDLILWWKTFKNYNTHQLGYNKKIKILVGYKNKHPVFILPLMLVDRYRKKLFKVTSLEFLTQSFNLSFLDLIHVDLNNDDINYIFEFIYSNIKYHYIDLCYLPENSILRKKFKKNVTTHSIYMNIPVKDSYEDIRKNIYSKNLRHVLNKFNRRIKESDINIEGELLLNYNDIIKYKDKIRLVSLSKNKTKNMHSIYNDKVKGNFIFNYILSKENPFCSIYKCENELLAYNLGYIENEVAYAIEAAYNREFSKSQKIGLGILAYDQIVEKLSVVNQYVNMGTGLDNYKLRFTKKGIFSYSLIIKGNKYFLNHYYNYLKNSKNKIHIEVNAFAI